ncbi:MAG: homoserine kinase [Liquorilactobacillus ghanensis]|uniref:homoserine kinase n=1 Tax=Liquorilactobacillus ghanensis TaxID=399370 RepID=UPI0039ECBF8B
MSFEIIVPATSANLGPGFDSIGIAVSRYLKVKVEASTASWQVEHQLGKDVPTDERNLIVKTALQIAPAIQPHHLIVDSEIPLARGLGSSSSAIIAGIELADHLAELNLSQLEKLQLATKIEGHPDNVAPAILGDLTVSTYTADQQVFSIKGHFPEMALMAFVPPTELLTTASRSVLPAKLNFSTAVKASSIGNTLVAALFAGDLKQAGQLMEQDQFHEQYRAHLVPHLAKLRTLGHQAGAIATYLSGAGPTTMTVIDLKSCQRFADLVAASGLSGELLQLKVERQGVMIR